MPNPIQTKEDKEPAPAAPEWKRLLEEIQVILSAKRAREEARQHRDDPKGKFAAGRIREAKELKRRNLESWVPPSSDTFLRKAIRGPNFRDQVPEEWREQQRELQLAILKGESDRSPSGTYPLDIAIPALRHFSESLSGEKFFRALGLDDVEAEQQSEGSRVAVGSIAGLKKGLEAQKFLPHPVLRAAAPVVGTIGGGIAGYLMGGEVPTKGETLELAGYGMGYGSILTQATKLGWLARMGIGGAEAASIGILARQSKSLADAGELSGINVPALLMEAGLGMAIGPFVKPDSPNFSGETFSKFKKQNQIVTDMYKNNITLLEGQLGGRGKGKYGSKFKTPQDRVQGQSLLKKLRQDLKVIKNHPEVFWGHGDPETVARMLALKYMENPMYKHRMSHPALGRGEKDKAFLNSVEYLESLGTDKPLRMLSSEIELEARTRGGGETYQLNIPMIRPGELAELNFETWKDVLSEAGAVLSLSKNVKDTNFGKLASLITFGNFKRLYIGAADVIGEAARKSGEGPNNYGFALERALHNAVVDGDRVAAGLIRGAIERAEAQGFNTFKGWTKGSSKLARKEFEEYQRLRHSSDGGPRGEGDMSVRTGMSPDRGDVPLGRKEPLHLTEGIVADNLRIARSREAYHGYSEMGKALIDGFDEQAKVIARMMADEGVVVVGVNGKTRLAQVDQKYFPRHLKYKYEHALRNFDKLVTSGPNKGKRRHRKVIAEMVDIMGLKTPEALKHRFKDMMGASSGDAWSQTGEIFSHLERARTAGDIPPELLDFSHDLATGYLAAAGKRLGEIHNFGQMYRKPGLTAGRESADEDYIFKRGAENIRDESTKRYLELLHAGIFGRNTSLYNTANRWLTGAAIANPFSAMKNLTGLAKTGTVVSNKAFSLALLRQLADSAVGIAHGVRRHDKLAGNTALAKRIGVISADIGIVTQMLDNNQMGGLSRKHVDVVGGLLKLGGFTPAEEFVRKHALQAFQIERADFLSLVDESPEMADRLAYLIKEIKYYGLTERGPGLRAELRKLTGVGAKNKLEALAEAAYGKSATRLTREEMVRNRRLAEHMRFMVKMDIDPMKLSTERYREVVKGQWNEVPISPESSPETMRFFQKSVNEVQGGYRYNQLPLFMNQPETKLLMKFMQWSQQMQRHFDKNIVSEATEGNIKPLMKYLAGMQIAGETMRFAGGFFGREHDDASLAEIQAVLNDGHEGEAAKMILIRMANNAFIGGQWDYFGELVGGTAIRYAETGRIDPISLPLLDYGNLVQEAFSRRFTQGGDNERLWKDLGRLFSLGHRTGQLATEAGLFGPDRKGLQDYRKASTRMKGLHRRWTEAPVGRGGRGKEKEASPGQIPIPKGYTFKRDLREALILGDSQTAKTLTDEYIWSSIKTDDDSIFGEYDKWKKKVEQIVHYGAPISTAEKKMQSLTDYLKMNDPKLAVEMLTYQKRYLDTAREAGLIPREEGLTATDKSLERLKNRAKGDNSWLDAYAVQFYKTEKDKRLSDQSILDKLNRRILQMHMEAQVGADGKEVKVGRYHPDGRAIRAGDREAFPFNKTHLGTVVGRIWAKRIRTRVAAEIAKSKKQEALSKVLIDPRFLEISEPIGRAEFIEKEWDRLGKTEEEKDALIRKLSQLFLLDSVILPTGAVWSRWRADRATFSARELLKRKAREKEGKEKK